ncbi:hypothetical protein [Streptomyces sp. AA0539]|uniref:hypothetical protein n=1 Tax=Streptomyces sp. AA0539 TaxID=1210045 RepID=UPI0002F6CC9D|nr:hypothetical protein [Streptomyces sp. AA0539]
MIATRSVRRLPAAVLLLPVLALPLASCGSETPAAPASEVTEESGAPPASSSPAQPPEESPAGTGEETVFPGVDPGLIQLTEIPGYTLAPQSAGVVGEDGWGVSYVAASGSTIELRVERAEPGAADTGISADKAAGITEFHRILDGLRVSVITTDPDIDPDVLRAALEAARPADAAEVVSAQEEAARDLAGEAQPTAGQAGSAQPGKEPASGPQPSPGERGDLPPVGDGAPVQPEGASG